jgi:hypothetical protein
MGFCKIFRVKWRLAILAGMPCESPLSSCCTTRTKSDASKQCFRKSWLHPETRLGRCFSGNRCEFYAPSRLGGLTFARRRLITRQSEERAGRRRAARFPFYPAFALYYKHSFCEFSGGHGRSHDHGRCLGHDRSCSGLASCCRNAVGSSRVPLRVRGGRGWPAGY